MSTDLLVLVAPMKMFSATDTSGQSAISWWTRPIPRRCAMAGDAISTNSPWKKIWPLSGRMMPSTMFISVDFPAPFSPAMAWISPLRSSKSTARRAWIGPKDLLTLESLRTRSSATAALVHCSPPRCRPHGDAIAGSTEVVAVGASVRIPAFHVSVQVERIRVLLGNYGESIVDERNLHRVVARHLVVVERVEHVGMRGHEGRDEAHETLHALIGVQGHVDVPGPDMLQRRRRDVGVHDEDLRLGLHDRRNGAFRRAGLGNPQCAELRVGLQDRRRRAIGGIAVLVGRLAAHQLHLRVMLFHVGDQRRHAQVVVALSRVLQNRIFGAVADLL